MRLLHGTFIARMDKIRKGCQVQATHRRNRVICLLLVACVLLAFNYTYILGGIGEDRFQWLKQLDNWASANESQEALNNWTVGYTEQLNQVRRRQKNSLYYLDPVSLLPLLRLRPAELDPQWRVTEAKAWLRRQTVVFAGTVRNGMSGLPSSVRNVRRLGAMLANYWLLLVENDSTDSTRQYLHRVRKSHNQTVVLGCLPVNSHKPCHIDVRYRTGLSHLPGWAQPRNREENTDRTVVMSALRNMYLTYAYENVPNASLLIVIEPDVRWADWDLDSLAQGLYYMASRPRMDLLCANTKLWGQLYDTCSRTYFLNKHFGEDRTLSLLTDEVALEKNKQAPVKVDSCFQAFAVFRFSSLRDRRLVYGSVPGEWNCEHNTLARQLDENYIDPEMKLLINSIVTHEHKPSGGKGSDGR